MAGQPASWVAAPWVAGHVCLYASAMGLAQVREQAKMALRCPPGDARTARSTIRCSTRTTRSTDSRRCTQDTVDNIASYLDHLAKSASVIASGRIGILDGGAAAALCGSSPNVQRKRPFVTMKKETILAFIEDAAEWRPRSGNN